MLNVLRSMVISGNHAPLNQLGSSTIIELSHGTHVTYKEIQSANPKIRPGYFPVIDIYGVPNRLFSWNTCTQDLAICYDTEYKLELDAILTWINFPYQFVDDHWEDSSGKIRTITTELRVVHANQLPFVGDAKYYPIIGIHLPKDTSEMEAIWGEPIHWFPTEPDLPPDFEPTSPLVQEPYKEESSVPSLVFNLEDLL